MEEKKSILKDILGKIQPVYSRLQRNINAAADKTRTPIKPFNTVKDLPGVRRPIIADPREKKPIVSVTPPSERPVIVPKQTQRIMPSNPVSMPNVPLNKVTRTGTINKPIFGSIQRPVSS